MMESSKIISGCRVQRMWKQTSSRFVFAIENIFFQLGVWVALKPWSVIAFTCLFVSISSLGFLNFHMEKDPMKLWVPPGSDFDIDTNWYMQNFGTGFRLQNVLITSENVLDLQVLLRLLEITKKVQHIQMGNITLQDLCLKVPVVKLNTAKMKNKRKKVMKPQLLSDDMDDSNYFDFTGLLSSNLMCSIIDQLEYVCYQKNILDIWLYRRDIIQNLTLDVISNQIDSTVQSPTTGRMVDYRGLLGGVQRDAMGNIVSAKSILSTWFTKVDFSTVNLDEVGNLIGTQDWVSLPTLSWEAEFLSLMESLKQNDTNITIYYQAGRSYGDVSGDTMFQEMDKLFIGIALMFVYIQIVLSNWNCLEIRLTLGSVGLLCVGFAYFAACGWCSIFGIPYGPVHASLPFLLMGLGIDDMFVMQACWQQLTDDDRCKSLSVQVGLMLKHAGVSIVITSFTDIVAFLIGSITILPSLKSFCIYAAMGVFFIFCFSVTFYVAIFTLDVKRVIANRNGVVVCYKHKRKRDAANHQTCFQRCVTDLYRHFIFTVPVKVIVIAFTVVMTAFSIEAVLNLEQRFNPDWFIPSNTYLKQFLDKYNNLYPTEGEQGFVFLGHMNYTSELPVLYEMVQSLRNESCIKDTTSWIEGLHNYVSKSYIKNFTYSNPTEEEFNIYLSKFLFTPSGGEFQQSFQFSNKLSCGRPAPRITSSSFHFQFTKFSGPDEYIPAMNKVKQIVKSANITSGDGYRSVWSKVFANWATDEIIGLEVERNIELALICVMACTMFLITDLQMCLWIFVCVLLTLLNVCGWMQRWGMTIDIVSCIGLELAIGLCVDYAAHVGHTFLAISAGTRSERSLKTVTSIGTAVLYGGGSTLLSLCVLSLSRSYTFNSFFKIFVLVIIFGLFHGLIFLPVILSLIGPKPYHNNETEDDNKVTAAELEIIDISGKCDDEI